MAHNRDTAEGRLSHESRSGQIPFWVMQTRRVFDPYRHLPLTFYTKESPTLCMSRSIVSDNQILDECIGISTRISLSHCHICQFIHTPAPSFQGHSRSRLLTSSHTFILFGRFGVNVLNSLSLHYGQVR
jgi:hypothetical protein